MLGANIYVQYNSYFTRTRLSFQTITQRFSMSTGFTEDMSEGHSQRLCFPGVLRFSSSGCTHMKYPEGCSQRHEMLWVCGGKVSYCSLLLFPTLWVLLGALCWWVAVPWAWLSAGR